MSRKQKPDKCASPAAATREDRLKAALKANLQRRKQQGAARGTKSGTAKEAE